MTRVVALGPTDFLIGLSKGGVLRVRPGLANPCLLAPATSMLGRGLSTVKRVGVSLDVFYCFASILLYFRVFYLIIVAVQSVPSHPDRSTHFFWLWCSLQAAGGAGRVWKGLGARQCDFAC